MCCVLGFGFYVLCCHAEQEGVMFWGLCLECFVLWVLCFTLAIRNRLLDMSYLGSLAISSSGVSISMREKAHQRLPRSLIEAPM